MSEQNTEQQERRIERPSDKYRIGQGRGRRVEGKSRGELQEEARKLGVPYWYRMTKEELEQEIEIVTAEQQGAKDTSNEVTDEEVEADEERHRAENESR